MDGHETTFQILQFNKGAVIIAQKSYGLTGDQQKAIDTGRNEHLSKSADKDKLLRLIQMYLMLKLAGKY